MTQHPGASSGMIFNSGLFGFWVAFDELGFGVFALEAQRTRD